MSWPVYWRLSRLEADGRLASGRSCPSWPICRRGLQGRGVDGQVEERLAAGDGGRVGLHLDGVAEAARDHVRGLRARWCRSAGPARSGVGVMPVPFSLRRVGDEVVLQVHLRRGSRSRPPRRGWPGAAWMIALLRACSVLKSAATMLSWSGGRRSRRRTRRPRSREMLRGRLVAEERQEVAAGTARPESATPGLFPTGTSWTVICAASCRPTVWTVTTSGRCRR